MLRQDRILALDIGASGLKIAEFVALRSGGVELVNFGVASLNLDPQSDGDRQTYITTTVRELLQDRGIKTGPVLLSVSGQSVFSRFVKLPPVDKEKIDQIILYEAQQNVPFPIEEVVWDYQLIRGAGGEVDVMLAAIKAEIVEHVTDCIEQAGLEPDLVDVAPMALYNAVRYNYTELPGCVLVVDIGARSTDLIFIEQNRLFSRSIPVAGNAITQQIMAEFNLSFLDAEELKKAHAFVAFGGAYEGPKSEVVDKVSKSVRSVMTRMHAEINRSINFYRSQQSGQAPSIVLLTGGTSVIPYTDSFLKDKMKVEVDYLNPFLNVAVSERIQAEEIGRNANLMGQVVGLALRRVLTCPIELNLMPPKVLADKAFRKKQPMFVLAAVALIVVLVVWCGYFLRMTGLSKQRLDKVAARVGQLQAVESRLDQAKQQVSEVDGRINRLLGLAQKRSEWLQVLDAIHACLPDGVWLTSVKPLQEAQPGASESAEGAPAQAEAPAIKAIEIAGLGYRDKVASGAPVREFRDRLRSVPRLSAQTTEIIWLPAPSPEEYVIQFKVRVGLKNPLEL
ncbi:MAG: type IV pilus assembly protein PilM [Verrucomicrobiota bacterium]